MSDLNANDYTLTQLREWLRILELPVSGNKAQLVLRLNEVPADRRGVCPNLGEVELEDYEADGNIEDNDSVEQDNVSDSGSQASSVNREKQLLQMQLDLEKREKELLKKEIEILKKEATLGKSSQSVDFKTDFAFATIKDTVPDFDENARVEQWIIYFKSAVRMFELTDSAAKTLLCCKVKGSGQTWLMSKENYVSMNIDVLLNEMREVFSSGASKLEQRNKFQNRKWSYTESFKKYYDEKMVLANSLNMDEAELLEHLIAGIANIQLRNQAKMLCFDSPDKLLRAFSQLELPQPHKNNFNVNKTQVAVENPIRCYNCNSVGHYAGNCSKPKRPMGACYGCGSLTHKVNACPERKMVHAVDGVDHVKQLKIYINQFTNFCVYCLIDSGSPISFIKKECVPHNITFEKCNENYFGINKSPLNIIGKILCSLRNKQNATFYVIVVADDSMRHEAIIGRDLMNLLGIKLVFEQNQNIFECMVVANESLMSVTNDSKRIVSSNRTSGGNDIKNADYVYKQIKADNSKVEIANDSEIGIKRENMVVRKYLIDYGENNLEAKLGEENNDVNCSCPDIFSIEVDPDVREQSYKIGKELLYKEKVMVENLLQENYFNTKWPKEPLNKYYMNLNLKCVKPFHCSPRRLSYTEKKELQILIDEYLMKGYIRPSESEFVSPIVLIRKKTGDLRMCVDYRTLNKITEKDNFPIPLIDDLLDSLVNKLYFTKLDLKNGFFHVFMDPKSIKYTSFITPLGQYEFVRMPFGLKNAPSCFQRFVNKVFVDMIRSEELIIYLDDIMIATEDIDNHLKILKKVLKRLKENNLELRLDKCEFLMSTVKYLGYTVSGSKITPDEKGIVAVKNYPSPKTVREVQSFLGLCSYFRRFIKNFSLIAKPLYDMTKKNEKFNFGKEQLESFETLKNKLLQSPVLAIYDPNDAIELHCDASSLGFGAILLQKKADGKWHPIFYFSKRTTEVESKYHSFELETLAIIYALQRFRIYLQGKTFKIVTDCLAVTSTLKKKNLNLRIARWALELENYDYSLEHRSGERMQHVDAFSRSSVMIVDANTFEDNLIICQGKDEKLRKLKELLENQEHKRFEMCNGIIYRKKSDGAILFYVPEAMENNVIYKYHDELGHVGIDKVVNMIGKSYWFPNVKEQVSKHILNCLRCITFSDKPGRKEGFLHVIPKGKKPFEVIHIDHIGPLENPKNCKKHILVIVDSVTKFTRLYPTKTTKSKEAVQALNILERIVGQLLLYLIEGVASLLLNLNRS